jgi:hypothetical protein
MCISGTITLQCWELAKKEKKKRKKERKKETTILVTLKIHAHVIMHINNNIHKVHMMFTANY